MSNSKETGESVARIPGVGVTMPVAVPVSQGKPLNLVVHGLEQAGPSYEVRVFIGNKSANIGTPLHSQYGFVGTIPIYGYGPSMPTIPGAADKKARSPMSRELILPEESEKMISGKQAIPLTLIPVHFGKDISAEDVFAVENAELRVKTQEGIKPVTSEDGNGK